jgi:hypothetical protein
MIVTLSSPLRRTSPLLAAEECPLRHEGYLTPPRYLAIYPLEVIVSSHGGHFGVI